MRQKLAAVLYSDSSVLYTIMHIYDVIIIVRRIMNTHTHTMRSTLWRQYITGTKIIWTLRLWSSSGSCSYHVYTGAAHMIFVSVIRLHDSSWYCSCRCCYKRGGNGCDALPAISDAAAATTDSSYVCSYGLRPAAATACTYHGRIRGTYVLTAALHWLRHGRMSPWRIFLWCPVATKPRALRNHCAAAAPSLQSIIIIWCARMMIRRRKT